MLARGWLAVVLIAATPLCCEVNTNAAGQTEGSETPEDSLMLTPPPVSGQAYPVAGTAETRSNYLRGGLTFSSAYSDSVQSTTTGYPVSDVSYSFWPTIALDQTTTRLHLVLTSSSGFTFYQGMSALNEADQNVGLDVKYRLSPHVTVSFRDSFRRSSNLFNQPDLESLTSVSGAPQALTVAVIPPTADMLSNIGNGGISYQFGPTSMVGASGTFTNLHYPNPAQVPGLYDSSSTGGSAFYSHRLSKRHYIGVQYQYQRYVMFPTGEQDVTQTHTIFVFYTAYLKPTLSLSLSGGPQHSDATQPPLPTSRAWSPAAAASLGWQGRHTSFATSYSRMVSSGGGLLGSFHTTSARATARWQFARTWSAGLAAGYFLYENVTPLSLISTPGGHTVSGTVSVQHQLGEHLSIEAGYTRLYQSYSGIAVIFTAPNTNREFVSISYRFTRLLGR